MSEAVVTSVNTVANKTVEEAENIVVTTGVVRKVRAGPAVDSLLSPLCPRGGQRRWEAGEGVGHSGGWLGLPLDAHSCCAGVGTDIGYLLCWFLEFLSQGVLGLVSQARRAQSHTHKMALRICST